MSILEAVIILAGAIKQVADDTSANAAMVTSLAARVEIIPRVLKKIPENNELDPELLNRMHDNLKEAHRLIVKYKSRNAMARVLTATATKAKFTAVEVNLSRCIDDLSFNVGISSAAMLENIRTDMKKDAQVSLGKN